MALKDWSTTPATNATAGLVNWAEGQAPSTVNNSARQMMADVAVYMTDPQFYDHGLTPTYVSGTSLTLVGDQTAAYSVGRRVKATVTAGTVYGVIATSVYTTLTTLTVTMDSGALDSGLSVVSLSILTPANVSIPQNIKLTNSITGNADGTASNLSGTPTVPNGTSATTQTSGDNSTKLATTAYVDAGVATPGEVRQTFRTTAPSTWYLLPNAAQTAVSRVGTYANISALMATLGYPFGAGDGSTTFVMPWIPTGYTFVQAVSAATAGALSHGKVKSHTHTFGGTAQLLGGFSAVTSFVTGYGNTVMGVDAPEGGADNLAAGSNVLICVKY